MQFASTHGASTSAASTMPPPPDNGHNFRGFTSPSTQSTLHQIALSLSPQRKQNVACDACRSRKVKCVRLPGQDKCQHCTQKNCNCTHYVQQATTERRRGSNPYKKRTSLALGHLEESPALNSLPSPVPLYQSPSFSSTSSDQDYGPTARLVAFLLSPYDHLMSYDSFRSQYGSAVPPTPPEDWEDISMKLKNEAFRIEFALDLVEVYFQICHTRLPLLNPTQFRQRLHSSLPHHIISTLAISQSVQSSLNLILDTPEPLHPALLAAVMAWGAKFSEHPILLLDRERNNGRSRIAKTLLSKAIEIAEAEKVHRVPSADHVLVSLLVEPLQSLLINGFGTVDTRHNFWISCAIRHLFDIGVNRRSIVESAIDAETRGSLKFAFWVACLSDAYMAAFYRRKPVLEDDDYNIEFLGESSDEQATILPPGVPETAQSQFRSWLIAAHSMAQIIRSMSRHLWRPVTEAEGIGYQQLSSIVLSLFEWRDEHLVRVGVPSDFRADWDFVAAVSACSSDAQYHVIWVILYNALEEFGIRELNEVQQTDGSMSEPPGPADVEALKSKVFDEAIHGAVRIAALAGVLTSNGYLRLDPNVLHFAVYSAGMLLAKLGKSEVHNCIAGLQQYGYAYEEAFDQATEMQRTYTQAVEGIFVTDTSRQSTQETMQMGHHSLDFGVPVPFTF